MAGSSARDGGIEPELADLAKLSRIVKKESVTNSFIITFFPNNYNWENATKEWSFLT